MSDKDTQTRGKFEPPPWEREAFDALAARRAEEDAIAAALAAATAKVAATEAPKSAAADIAELLAAAERTAVEPEVPAPAPQEPVVAPASTVDEQAVEAMLLKLQAEETTDGTTATWVGWIASVVTFLLGGAMVVFGLLSVRGAESKFVNVIGSAVLVIFGLCFMGMAVWMWIRTNRSKGRR